MPQCVYWFWDLCFCNGGGVYAFANWRGWVLIGRFWIYVGDNFAGGGGWMCGSICACHGRSPISPEGGAGRWGGRWAGFGERVARPLASQMRVIRAIILIANDYQNHSQSIPPFPNVEIYIGLPSFAVMSVHSLENIQATRGLGTYGEQTQSRDRLGGDATRSGPPPTGRKTGLASILYFP